MPYISVQWSVLAEVSNAIEVRVRFYNGINLVNGRNLINCFATTVSTGVPNVSPAGQGLTAPGGAGTVYYGYRSGVHADVMTSVDGTLRIGSQTTSAGVNRFLHVLGPGGVYARKKITFA